MIDVDVQDGHDCGELAALLALEVRRSSVKSGFDIGSPKVWLWRGLVTGMAAGLRKAGTNAHYTSAVITHTCPHAKVIGVSRQHEAK